MKIDPLFNVSRKKRYDKTSIRWFHLDAKLLLFALFSVGLVTVDLGSDGTQSYIYLENGDLNWGYSTITIVFVPFATILVSEILKHIIRKYHGEDVTMQDLLKSLKIIGRHFPSVQPFVHLSYLIDLKVTGDQIKRSLKFYKSLQEKESSQSGTKYALIDDINDENRIDYQNDVKQAAKEYVKAKQRYLTIMTEFQKMKLYEAFGESAPQAAFQIGIVLQIGTISPTQIFSIGTSLFSLTLAASEILLMMATKDKPVKEANWKATWLLIFPAMFMVVVPRILSLGLIMAYTKGYFLMFIFGFFILSVAINFHHLQRDPPEVMVGILTNLFASCTVVQEGSGFYKRSGVVSSVLHALGLLCLFLMVVGNVFNTCPDTSINRYAPILHCFQLKFPMKNGMHSCQWPTSLDKSTCTSTFNNLTKDGLEKLQCTTDFLEMENKSTGLLPGKLIQTHIFL